MIELFGTHTAPLRKYLLKRPNKTPTRVHLNYLGIPI